MGGGDVDGITVIMGLGMKFAFFALRKSSNEKKSHVESLR